MTETEWLMCTDPTPMLKFLFLQHRVSARKLRLFSLACSRSIWHLLKDERSRVAVEVAERFADGLASDEERRDAIGEAEDATEAMRTEGQTYDDAACAAEDLVYSERLGLFDSWSSASGFSETTNQASLLRDLFLFRPITFDPHSLSTNVIDLARAIYEESVWSRMPILAEALMDAGCDNAEILNHCRGSGPHTRGCFVVDTILNKS